MKTTTRFNLSLATLALTLAVAPACGAYKLSKIDPTVILALSDTEEEAIKAIAELRSRGERGLEDVLEANFFLSRDPRFAAVVDQVAKQKDALKSRLYWHTDFNQALAVAAKTGRPILSLRLLGKLDEEFSCANSRLFREVYYAKPDLGNYLREHFVLHWESVRPVPVMTIDYGDGRVLKRTITGNSAHYILDSTGRVVDALPGLYTPEKFRENLEKAAGFVKQHRKQTSQNWRIALAEYHKRNFETLNQTFLVHLDRSGLAEAKSRLSEPVEMTDLKTDEWAKLAAIPAKIPVLNPAVLANALTRGKGKMETPILTEFVKADLAAGKRTDLEVSTAADSVRNEYVFHRRIHQRLSQVENHVAIARLNSWVYADLFKMPDSDPWLGLHTPGVFTGLKDNGIVSTGK